ncbi:MerR family transcriptional regulator [Streptococcus merionis]|uniref:MerR family transcriptional regulator n=1 Tax=Streptococcus merionis TaxID=400065 RepID=UPI0026EE3441|nr:MerR family transcriptional regulator [Streptococcus merionis]
MKIQEVSKLFNIPSPTLRYYEDLGLIEEVPRISNRRDYNDNHIDQINFIICMKKTGLSLKEIQNYVHLYLSGPQTGVERIDILEQQKARTLEKIRELENIINYIDQKIITIDEEKQVTP